MENKTEFAVSSHARLLVGSLVVISLVSSLFLPGGCSSEALQPKVVISPEDFGDSLEYLGIAVKKADTHVWGTSAVIDEETGKVHLFAAEWDSLGMEFSDAWWHKSQIAHYVGNRPEGPFRFVETLVKDADGTFNSPHNPSVLYLDGKYVLTFIVNEEKGKVNQHIIMYIADSPNGPWRSTSQATQRIGEAVGCLAIVSRLNAVADRPATAISAQLKTQSVSHLTDAKPVYIYETAFLL